ncbi:MAG: NAD-dependent epimerase/dehydratase family protein [Myxococcaceae bacterium]
MHDLSGKKILIAGGAGFIGSHFTDALLAKPGVAGVTLYDNFTSGQQWHYAHHAKDKRLNVVRRNVEDTEALTQAMRGHEVVIHLASNPDIAKAMTDPTVDFHQGTALTHSVVEAMRRSGAQRLLYASGSGVYGDLGTVEAQEDHGPMLPVSTYGASKLAGEALISSYCFMFGLTACAFRFGNVVGPRQTHGVGFDFVRRLRADPTRLRILGDGSQSKSYILVTDVVAAVLMAFEKETTPFRVFNVATGDYITVKEIAELAVECAERKPGSVHFEFTGGDRGWKGDVPVVRLSTARIQSLGWRCGHTSREALKRSMLAMIEGLKAGQG